MRIFYLLLGIISLLLGALGAYFPILPSFPFLLLAAFAFGKSSKRLANWFRGTKLYQENLASYIEDKSMSLKAKVKVMLTLSIVFGLGFIAMDQVLLGRIVLVVIWLFHVLYFTFRVKTKEE